MSRFEGTQTLDRRKVCEDGRMKVCKDAKLGQTRDRRKVCGDANLGQKVVVCRVRDGLRVRMEMVCEGANLGM